VTGRNELHLLDPETGELTQLSDGEVPRAVRAGFEWHPDGDRLFFHRDEAGDEQHDIHVIDLDGETEPVVEMDGQCNLGAVGEDGETLVFSSSAGGQPAPSCRRTVRRSRTRPTRRTTTTTWTSTSPTWTDRTRACSMSARRVPRRLLSTSVPKVVGC
jgi:Tol biopolymer transport system component